MKNQKLNGFTLLELVIVIVILGVLSVTAAPRFINLSDDASLAKLRQMAGSLKATADLYHAKAVIEQKHRQSSNQITLNGSTIELAYGYPKSFDNSGIKIAGNFGDVSGYGAGSNNAEHDWVTQNFNETLGFSGGSFILRPVLDITLGRLAPESGGIRSGNCYIKYKQATEDLPAEVELFTSGC